jgi:serine/threonine protein kinase
MSLEGQTLGKYRVLEPLGQGGMARVYRAYHPQLDRYVAIKVMRSDLAQDKEFLARFRREAQSVAGLRHLNIVQVFDFDVQGDVYYMVTELLEGDTLKARLSELRARGGQMPWGEMARLLLDVLDGLAYAHDQRIIHRDIKPANIMLTRQGQAVLTDFGIAQMMGGTRHTAAGALMGTLNYMAPEQGLKGQCDARSDVYSLGIVFYEMLTQNVPFDADTPLAILMKHLNDPLVLPRRIDPQIPESLERVVLKALAKRPEDRHQSASEMALALRQAVDEAEVALPVQISLSHSFTTVEAPSESVAVLSGTERQQIGDPDFAKDQTDTTLGQRLEAEDRARLPVEDVVRDLAESVRRPLPLWRAIVGSVALLLVYNLLALWGAGMTGWWEIFQRGWPVELFLVALGLCLIMYASSNIWLLMPAGIVLGNGALFSYYVISNNWSQWAFCWPFEPLVISGAVWSTIWLARRRELAQRLLRPLALVMGLGSIAWSVALLLASIAIAVVN